MTASESGVSSPGSENDTVFGGKAEFSPECAQAVLGSRALFPELQAKAYLAHAAISPLMVPVQSAINDCALDLSRNGVGAFLRWLAQRGKLRARLARMVGAEPEDVAFTASTSQGLRELASALELTSKDAIVLFRGEFPANIRPWLDLAERSSAEIRWIDSEEFRSERGLELLEEATKDGRCRLLAVSATQFSSGIRMPLQQIGEICSKHEIIYAVDSIQQIGADSIDVKACKIDFLANGGHKFLLGAEGAAFLYAAPALAERLKPRSPGWLAMQRSEAILIEPEAQLDYQELLREGAGRFENGTLAAVPLAALGAATEVLAELEPLALRRHLLTYGEKLTAVLEARGFEVTSPREEEQRSALILARPPIGEALAWAGALGKKGGDHTIGMLKTQFKQVMDQLCCERVEDLPNHLINE